MQKRVQKLKVIPFITGLEVTGKDVMKVIFILFIILETSEKQNCTIMKYTIMYYLMQVP